MESEDLSDNPRIAMLTTMMLALEQSHSPDETIAAIRRGLAGAYGHVSIMNLATRSLAPGEYKVLRLELDEDAPANLDSRGSWFDVQSEVQCGGVIAQIIQNRKPQIIHEIDWSEDPYFRHIFANFRSVLAIPFAGRHTPLDWVFFLRRRSERFTLDDLHQAMLRVALIVSLLESQTLVEKLALANKRIDQDIRQVASVQRSLLPDLPNIAGLELAASYEPSGKAGGDMYDFFPLDDSTGNTGRWCILMADASGHGPAAAVVMAIVQTILRLHPPDVAGPADLLAHVNHHLCRKMLSGFVTAFLAVYDPPSRRLIYASAGHPSPLLKTADGAVSQLNFAASYPLGIDHLNTFCESAIQLHPGDLLLLYTDGITEARGPNQAMLDLSRLESEFRNSDHNPNLLVQHLKDVVTDFQKGRKPVDDQTLVAILSVEKQ